MNKVKDLLSGCDLHKLLGVLYSEFVILIAMIFLAVPLWVFPVILILQIPMISKLKSSKSFLPYSILYVVFLCAFGYFTSSIFYRFLMISVASAIILYIRKFG